VEAVSEFPFCLTLVGSRAVTLFKAETSGFAYEALIKVGQAPSLRHFSEHFSQDAGASPSFVRRSKRSGQTDRKAMSGLEIAFRKNPPRPTQNPIPSLLGIFLIDKDGDTPLF